MSKCKICEDKKHVKKDGYWVKCSCLLDERFRYDFEQSEADLSFLSSKLSDFTPKTPNAISAVDTTNKIISAVQRKEIPKKSICFISRFNGSRFILAYEIVKEFIRKDLLVRVISVDDLFEVFINRDPLSEGIKQFVAYDLILLNLGLEFSNKAAPHLIKTLYRLRKEKEKFTIITSKHPVNRIKDVYDEEVYAIFADARRIWVYDLD